MTTLLPISDHTQTVVGAVAKADPENQTLGQGIVFHVIESE